MLLSNYNYFKFYFQCLIYLETNVTNCIVPCILDGCDVERRRDFNCPIWVCEDKTTTSSTSTTTPDPSTTTAAPDPSPITTTPWTSTTSAGPKPEPDADGKLINRPACNHRYVQGEGGG